MSIKGNRRLGFGILAFLLLAATLSSPSWRARAVDKEKLTAEEVLARHLKSIGTAEDLAAAKTRIVVGNSLFTARSPGTGQNSGLSMLFSEGNKSVVAMTFANPSYPHEKFGYDGENLVISYVRPGTRSTLGDFVYRRTSIFKEGLMGGTLSTAWPLLNLTKEKGRIEYAGIKKIDGKENYVLRYVPRKGSDLQITLYFDGETFQHVRTDYDQTIAPQMGATADASKEGQRELHYNLEEQFSDYKQEGKLTLPHAYKIKLRMEGAATTYIADWEMVLSKFSFNQPLNTSWFDVNAEMN
ncbi:MAG TPA: hypothetical protein VGN90_03310 [Pyrinomonadaceae bacterium]|nr:hypothetical protein [Pyrinomonadaceae bacterium]